MKAAFLFSGQLRGFNKCHESLKSYLFDLFEESDLFFYCTTDDIERIDELAAYKPKCMVFEEDFHHVIEDVVDPNNAITYSKNKIEHNGYALKGRMQHYFLQWYGVKRVYEMMESYAANQNKKYDLVFRVRFDACPKRKFDLDSIKFDHVNVPNFEHWYGVHDRFACGSMENMKIYSQKYDNMKLNNMGLGNSEGRLQQHLKNFNIPVNMINFYYVKLNQDGTMQPGLAS